MAKSNSPTLIYWFGIFYRFVFAFILGYVCMMYVNLSLTFLFNHFLDKAEAIYLAAFISIFFYLAFIIISFCFHSLLKLTVVSLILTALLFGLSVGLN